MHDGKILTDRMFKIAMSLAWLAAYLENHGLDVSTTLWLAWIKDTDSVVAVLAAAFVLYHRWQVSRLGRAVSHVVEHAIDHAETRLTA